MKTVANRGVFSLSVAEHRLLKKLLNSGVLKRTGIAESVLKDNPTLTPHEGGGQPAITQNDGRVDAVQKIHVVLPAYNEAASLPRLLARFSTLALRGQLIIWVVDDGSRDDTAAIGRRGAQHLDVRLLSHARNLGLGQALQTGIRAAVADTTDRDVIVVMDADDTHDTNLISAMVKQIEGGSDIVLASRFVAGGDDATAPPFRRFLSRSAAFVFEHILPVSDVQDFTSGYRMYRASLLRRSVQHWGERLIEERGFACMVELLLKLRYCRPVITEVPLVLRYDRKAGKSKLKLCRTLLQYLKLGLRERLQPPPARDL